MRRLTLPTIALVVVVAGSVAIAQKPYPIFTPDDLARAMKTVELAFKLAKTSVAKHDFDDSKDYVSRSRDQLATTITFWRDRKKDDAVKMLRDTLNKMDDLDVALSVEQIDPAAVNAIAEQVDAACETCHAVYREQDPVTKAYRLKPGLVP